MDSVTSERSDIDSLLALDRDYANSVQSDGVRRFGEISAGDFLCSNPDGSLVDREGFPAQTARPVLIRGWWRTTRRCASSATSLSSARTSYTTVEGEPPNGRYTGVRARRGGTWPAVSAHVTR